MFVNKVVKEASLSQLMAQEGEIVRQIQVGGGSVLIRRIRNTSLDSDPYQKLGWIRIHIKWNVSGSNKNY